MIYADAYGNCYWRQGAAWYVVAQHDDEDDLGFLQTLIPIATSVAGGLIGGAQTRRAQESARDQQREAAYAAIRQIKDDMLACRIAPEDAVRAAQSVVQQYYAWADQALTVPSVRRSAEVFRSQPMGFNDSVRSVADKVDEARARCAPRATPQTTGGLSASVSAGGVPWWAIAALGVALLMLR